MHITGNYRTSDVWYALAILAALGGKADIGDAGALADQPLPHPVQCLQVELIGGS